MAFGSYEVGVIQRTPVPTANFSDEQSLAGYATLSWAEKRMLDSVESTSHAFVLPALLTESGATLAERAIAWADRVRASEETVAAIQGEIDDLAFRLYGLDIVDRAALSATLDAASIGNAEAEIGEDEHEEATTAAAASALAADLLAHALGTVLGRWDIRFATGEKPAPASPDPFAPLPVCPPGMLQNAQGLPAAPSDVPANDGDDYLNICLRAKPDHTTEIRRLFAEHPAPTFAMVDAIGAGVSWPQLQATLKVESARDILMAFLVPSEAQQKALKEQDGWAQEARELLRATLSLQLKTKGKTWAPIAEELWRFLLFSEFVFDLPGELPAALAGVPHGQAAAKAQVNDLCERLRSDLRFRAKYIAEAERVETELNLVELCRAIEDLGEKDTFYFEERTFLRRAIHGLGKNDLDVTRQYLSRHKKSVWLSKGESQAQWDLIQAALNLIEACDVGENQLPEHTRTQAALLDFYLSSLREVDRLQREFEQAVGDPKPRGKWINAHDRLLLGEGEADGHSAVIAAERLGIRGSFARCAVPRSFAPYRAGHLYFHGGASLAEAIVPVLVMRLEAAPVEKQQFKVELSYKSGAKRITTRLPVIEMAVFSDDLFAQELEILLEAQDAKGEVVGEPRPGGEVNAATGTVTLKPNQAKPMQVVLRMHPEFEGKFTVKAINPKTLTAYGSLNLETDYTV